MDKTGKKLLSLMFRSGETVCVSPNKFGYRSVPLERAMEGTVVLIPTEESLAIRKLTLEQGIERLDSSLMTMVALNPINGFREDCNCTAFRNFLVELDFGPLKEQLAYVKKIGLPYSAVVFSGNKSLHFLISLDTDLPSENIYRKLSEWTLNIATIADQMTKNPSRSIRIPGAYREPKKKQILVEFKGPTKLDDFVNWLKKHPDAMPKERVKRVPSGSFNFDGLKEWVVDRLINGLDPTKGRNIQWFSIACEFALAGYSEDGTLDILQEFFTPDRDFKEKEWRKAVEQGFKHIYTRN